MTTPWDDALALAERFAVNMAGVPASEVSALFIQGAVNRMGVSFHKYGPVAEAYPEKLNAIVSLELRLQRYRETGNTEWLMDVANFAMIEFMLPRHPKAHFRETPSVESPGRVWVADFDGEEPEVSQRANDGSPQPPDTPVEHVAEEGERSAD